MSLLLLGVVLVVGLTHRSRRGPLRTVGRHSQTVFQIADPEEVESKECSIFLSR
jgi:hypothetical protein